MPRRQLYIAAYDIANPTRLQQALRCLKALASGRQKSVFECFLTPGERDGLQAQVRGILDQTQDRFVLLRLDPRGKIRVRGRGRKPTDPAWFYVG